MRQIARSSPRYRRSTPKVRRARLVIGSAPMQETSRPMQAAITPLLRLSPEIPAMMVRPNMHTRKYSAVPSIAATLATCGARKSSISAEKMPPKVEAYSAIFSAALVRPCWLSG